MKLKDDAIPFIDAPPKCLIHIKNELKAQLDKMERQEVIRKVDEQTDWVSSLAYTTKRDRSLRICLDPQKLNNALRRCPHKIPTLEELNPMFTNAKIFTKLDAKAGYWAVKNLMNHHNYSLHSERHLDDTVGEDYHLDLTTPKTYSKPEWTPS